MVQQLRILQRGKVAVRYVSEIGGDDPSSLTLGSGECFSIGAVMALRASTCSYTALEDVFCYELSAESFFALLQKSAVLNFFCTQHLASLLGQSRQQLQRQFSQHVAEQQTDEFAARLADQKSAAVGHGADADSSGRRTDGGEQRRLDDRRR